MKQYLVMGVIILSAFCACNRSNSNLADKPKTKTFSSKVVLDWNEMAYNAMGGATYQHSLLASRINTMMHIAMHDAVNAVIPQFKTYALNKTDDKADPVVAAATAAHDVLIAAFPEKRASLDSMLQVSLHGLNDSVALYRGREIGKEAASAILAMRSNDGALADPFGKIDPSNAAGTYQAVPPFDILFAPFWKNMQPFGITSASQFRVAPQPALDSKAYVDGFEEVKRFGSKFSKERNAEQASYAQFWYEFSEAGWNRITRNAVMAKKSDLVTSARLFALVDMALADAYTAGWDSKFHYNFWRPFTAIRNAAIDGNSNTNADPVWEPMLPTPPVQDYPSTHSALGNAAATVLTSILGDNFSFSFQSPTASPANLTRQFKSFKQAALENADSRVMAGLHFRFSCDAGLTLGDDVGKWVVLHQLTPVR
ncbi:vanadium-dependent haloperoxidase [Flavitalea sp.]|nr:vanadium-dependent haloperoxidase [Flavitalea sp.]